MTQEQVHKPLSKKHESALAPDYSGWPTSGPIGRFVVIVRGYLSCLIEKAYKIIEDDAHVWYMCRLGND